MNAKEKELLPSGIPLDRLAGFNYQDRPVQVTIRNSPSDDLASAGLGREGLASPQAPGFGDPQNPTPDELRRRAIYENYRAIADMTEGGGYGRFYGPGVGYGLSSPPPELIDGLEIRGIISDLATVIIQIPEAFQPENSTVVLVPASSSRGVYGGILAAEWALQRGYAVVLTDKGGGTGFHYLSDDITIQHDGQLVVGNAPSEVALFKAPDSAERLSSFNDRHPHRIASKHAHSTLNVEARWPDYVLESARFALDILGTLWPGQFSRSGCRVIASGYSNGAAASIRAAERDSEGIISAVAVAEPNVTPVYDERFAIRQGESAPLKFHSKPLLEYAAVLNLFQPVANLALGDEVLAPLPEGPSSRRLQALQNKGIWANRSARDAANEACVLLEAQGLLKEQNYLAAVHAVGGVYEAMAVCLANCHGRFLVTDHLFGYSYAAVQEKTMEPRSLTPAELRRMYSVSTGLVPTADVAVVNDNSVGGPVQSVHSISPSSGLADLNLDGALALFQAATGVDPVKGTTTTGLIEEQGERVRTGMQECRASGTLSNKPCLIVNGRCDSIISPNHASRSYLGRNLVMEGEKSRLSYLEVQHAHHLDTLNALPGMARRYVPLTPYLFRALCLMDEHLSEATPLPPSQVVRSCPREVVDGKVAPLEERHLGEFRAKPGDDAIIMVDGVLEIPQ